MDTSRNVIIAVMLVMAVIVFLSTAFRAYELSMYKPSLDSFDAYSILLDDYPKNIDVDTSNWSVSSVKDLSVLFTNTPEFIGDVKEFDVSSVQSFHVDD